MATKAQIIDFIIETFMEPNGAEISKSKLESFKKAELEEFISAKNAEEDLKEWLKSA